MDIHFGGGRLQRICESEVELRRAYKPACAQKLMLRLTEIRAAASLADLRSLGGNCRELDGDRAGQLAVDLPGGRRLVFEPVDGWPASHRPGRGWKAIEAVHIIEIARCDDE